MPRHQRKKASDVFRDTQFVFGRKVPFSTAFPQVRHVQVLIEESGEGISEANHKRARSGDTLGEFVDCSNPRCYNGGVCVGSVLREMVAAGETTREFEAVCQGSEGSPKGRRVYRKCLNEFRVRIEIQYAQPSAGQSQDDGHGSGTA